MHHVGLHQCHSEIWIIAFVFALVLYLYHMLLFWPGESLPQWEQGQDQECKDDRPNEGGFQRKSRVSILWTMTKTNTKTKTETISGMKEDCRESQTWVSFVHNWKGKLRVVLRIVEMFYVIEHFRSFPHLVIIVPNKSFPGNLWSSELADTIWMGRHWLERLLTLMSGTGVFI